MNMPVMAVSAGQLEVLCGTEKPQSTQLKGRHVGKPVTPIH
jgi:hypothetical protein